VSVGVIDAGVAIAWIRGGHRSAARLDALFRSGKAGHVTLHLSVVNLAGVLLHTMERSQGTGTDAIALLRASGLRIHLPDEAIDRRVAKLDTSLADGFAGATAQELGARLHTTDGELGRQLPASAWPSHITEPDALGPVQGCPMWLRRTLLVRVTRVFGIEGS
jgi:hypothetical protein